MRYENWDVLLFPEDSNIPIQEFKTECSVTQGRDSPYLSDPSILNPRNLLLPTGNMTLLPVLTSYIPSLPENTPFRASVHCWDTPRPSRLMDGLMRADDALMFQFQVYIDGIDVANCTFGQRASWPQVIDLSSAIDKNGDQEPLLWPPFHPELLKSGNNAGDLYGRVVVVISEGFARPHRSPPIERVRDIMAFSFRHAPLQILELSNIAWPNPSMWVHAQQPLKYNSGSAYNITREPGDHHTHSPRRHRTRAVASPNEHIQAPAFHNPWAYKSFPTHPNQWTIRRGEPLWDYQEPFRPDPFIDPCFVDQHRGARSSRDDISMPDYHSSSSSSRTFSNSNMTGISYDHSKQPSITGLLNEDQYDRVFRTFSPPKGPVPGIQPPMSNSSAWLPTGLKLATAEEARPEPLTKSPSRPSLSSVLKEISQPGTREIIPELSTKLSLPFDPDVGDAITDEFYASPGIHLRVTKDTSVPSEKENGATVETTGNEDNRVNITPTKTAVDPTKRSASVGFVRPDSAVGFKDDTAVISSEKSQRETTPDELDANFVGTKLHLEDTAVGITAVD